MEMNTILLFIDYNFVHLNIQAKQNKTLEH